MLKSNLELKRFIRELLKAKGCLSSLFKFPLGSLVEYYGHILDKAFACLDHGPLKSGIYCIHIKHQVASVLQVMTADLLVELLCSFKLVETHQLRFYLISNVQKIINHAM